MVIFDTNILIELYRGNHVVREKIQQINADVFYISSITAAEFMVGAQDKTDFQRIKRHLEKYTIIPINTDISDIFMDLFRTYTLSHRPAVADTLIAATGLYYHLPIYTLNKKDFKFIPGVELI